MIQVLVVVSILSNNIHAGYRNRKNSIFLDSLVNELTCIDRISNQDTQQLRFAIFEKKCSQDTLRALVRHPRKSISALFLLSKKMAMSENNEEQNITAIETYDQAGKLVCDIIEKMDPTIEEFDNICRRHETTLAKNAMIMLSKKGNTFAQGSHTVIHNLDNQLYYLKNEKLQNVFNYCQQLSVLNSDLNVIEQQYEPSNDGYRSCMQTMMYNDYSLQCQGAIFTYRYTGVLPLQAYQTILPWTASKYGDVYHNPADWASYNPIVFSNEDHVQEEEKLEQLDSCESILAVEQENIIDQNNSGIMIPQVTDEEIHIEESCTLGCIVIKPITDMIYNDSHIIEEEKIVVEEEKSDIERFIEVHRKKKNDHQKYLPIAIQEKDVLCKNGFAAIANLPSSRELVHIDDQAVEQVSCAVGSKKKKKSHALRKLQQKERCNKVILSYMEALKHENDQSIIDDINKKLCNEVLLFEQYVQEKDQISGTIALLLADLYSKNCTDVNMKLDANYEKAHSYYIRAFESIKAESKEKAYVLARRVAQSFASPMNEYSKKSQKKRFSYAEFWYKKLLEEQVPDVFLPFACLYKQMGKKEQACALWQTIIEKSSSQNERFVALLQSTLLRVSEMPDEKASVWCGLLSLINVSELDYSIIPTMLDDDNRTQLIMLGQDVIASNSENQMQLTFLHLAGQFIVPTHYEQGKKFLEYAAFHGHIDSLQYILKNIALNPDEIIRYHNYCKGNAQISDAIHDLLKERILQSASSGNQRLINMWLRTAKDTIDVQRLVDKCNELQKEPPLDTMTVIDAEEIDFRIQSDSLLGMLLTNNDPLVTWLYIRAHLTLIKDELSHVTDKEVTFGIDEYELRYISFENMCNTMPDSIFKKAAFASLYSLKIVLARQYLRMRDECRAMEYGISLLPVVPPYLLDEVIKLIGSLGLLGTMELKPEWLKAVGVKDNGAFKQWCVKQLEKFAEQGDCDIQNLIAHYIIKKDVATPAEYMQAGRYLKQSSVNKNPSKTLDVSAVYAQIMLQQAGNTLNQLVAHNGKPKKRSLKQFKEKCFERDLLRLQCGTATFCNKNMANLRTQAANIMRKSFITDQEINYLGEFMNFIIRQYPESKNLKREAKEIIDYVHYMVGLYDRGGIAKKTFMEIMHTSLTELYTHRQNAKNDQLKKKLHGLFNVISMVLQVRDMTILLVPMT